MPDITVLLADDHTIFREGLCALLKNEEGITVIGEAATGAEAFASAIALQPSVIVMDITLPDYSGLRASEEILAKDPTAKIIVLSMSGDREFVTRAVEKGVKGYLIKQTAANELIRAIREVAGGNAYFSPSVALTIAESYRRAATTANVRLSAKEREILGMIASGKTSKEIAVILCVGKKTVAKHRQQIMNKLDIHDIAGLTRYVIEKKLDKM